MFNTAWGKRLKFPIIAIILVSVAGIVGLLFSVVQQSPEAPRVASLTPDKDESRIPKAAAPSEAAKPRKDDEAVSTPPAGSWHPPGPPGGALGASPTPAPSAVAPVPERTAEKPAPATPIKHWEPPGSPGGAVAASLAPATASGTTRIFPEDCRGSYVKVVITYAQPLPVDCKMDYGVLQGGVEFIGPEGTEPFKVGAGAEGAAPPDRDFRPLQVRAIGKKAVLTNVRFYR